MPEHSNTSHWRMSELDKVREFSGGVFVHAFMFNRHVLCHQLVVLPSGLDGAGSGAFTLQGLTSTSLPQCSNSALYKRSGEWRAEPTRSMLGIYNGKLVPKTGGQDGGRLTALKVTCCTHENASEWVGKDHGALHTSVCVLLRML
jgi:hypothetical protein